MPVLDLYSYRKKVAEGGTPDVFIYGRTSRTTPGSRSFTFGEKLLVGIIVIPKSPSEHQSRTTRLGRLSTMNSARDRGVLNLGEERNIDSRCEKYFLNCKSVEAALDLVELTFFYVDKIARIYSSNMRKARGIKITPNDAIKQLNERFRRAGVGYRFENGKIFRIDSELIHSEVVKPALQYLLTPGFEGPCEEFMSAYAHYRDGQMKDAITDANNAFESTLKTICAQRGWQFSQSSRSSDLLKIVRDNGLLPNYLDNSFDQLLATLKSGLPKVKERRRCTRPRGNTS